MHRLANRFSPDDNISAHQRLFIAIDGYSSPSSSARPTRYKSPARSHDNISAHQRLFITIDGYSSPSSSAHPTRYKVSPRCKVVVVVVAAVAVAVAAVVVVVVVVVVVAVGRAQVHAIQLPQASLLERLRNLMRFPCLHEGQHPRPPDFLEAIPEGRVQDLPGGELPVDQQCSEEQSTLRAWLDIPNVDLLRADIMCTAAVPRHAHPVLPARYHIGRSERASSAGIGGDPDRAAFVDEDALAVDSDGGDNGTNEPGAADDAATMQLPPELQPHPPRVQPRPCVDDPISVEVPFCMRLDTELPNRTVFPHDDAPDEFTICTSCEKALAARRIPEAALARLDPGDVPSVNHLGDPLPAPTFVESQLLGRGRLMQQLMIVHLAGRPPEVLPCAVQSHGIAVVNPDPNMLRGQLPARVADLAGAFTVVCVDQVRDRQDLLDRVRRAPGLKVRGNVVVAWVRFLQHNDEDEGAVDEEAIQEYERMGCIAQVPEALLRSTIGPTDPEVAGVLRSTFLHDRTGAAGVRQLHETLQGNIVGNNFDGGGVYGSPLETAGPTGTANDILHDAGAYGPPLRTGPDVPAPGTTTSDTRMADAGATGLAPVAVVLRQPGDPADANLGIPNELEVVLPQPAPVPTDGTDFDNRPNVVHDLLTGRARLAFAAGGRGAQILDDRHPAILNVCFPVSFPYGLSGQRPPGMSFASYCSHLVRRVPRAQFSGNLMLLARMYDISVRQQSMAQRRHLLSQQSPVVCALLDGTRASLLRIDLTDAYYNGAKATMRAAALTIGWPPLFFNLNPADMHASCAVVASGQVIDFDDAGRPTHISSTVEKWRRVKEDPHSCAALLIATKEVLPLVMGMSNTEAQQHGLSVPEVQANCPPAAYDFECLAGSTCKRHGCRGTDDSCGMAFPRFIRTAFQWVGTTGLFLLPRLASNLVPHMPAIALAFGCNHLMSLACEVDRDYTADIAAQLARPINERGDCPLLQPAIDRARDTAYYSSKYTAKTIECSQAHLTCTAVGRVQDFMMAGHQPSATGHEPSVFGNLCTAVHRMTATITAGMALVAFKLSGHDTFQATYKRNYLATGAFTALASDSAVEPEDAETGVELVEADEHGDYTLANVVQNYTQRGVELSGLDCSAYTIASNFEVKPVLVNGTQQSDRITAGMPTYLRLARPPTIDETIELFTLAPDQAVPFMLMARYFDRRNQPDPGVPPQMLVMGPPGTGKTQFVHALLWYTYQHDSPDWAATCAYSWAAAIAFNTPVHRSLSTHSMFGISASQSGSRGTNFPKRGAHAGLQVKCNVGDGAVLIDEIGMQSHEHLGAISHSCTATLPPPPHLGPAHDSSRVLSGRAAGGIGDLLQHPQPGGSPPYRYAADVERNPQFTPSAPTAQRTPASLDEGRGHRIDDSNNDNTDADDDTGNRRATTSTRRTRRPVPQTHTRLHDGFNLYRQLGGTVFMLQKQQRQDNSPSGQQLTRFTTMFGGIPTTEARVADLVDALNQRVITDLSDLTDLEPRVMLQRNEPRHALNTRLLMLQARRKGVRLVSWNADHVPVRQHGATQQQALSHVEKAVAMRVKDAIFDHTTADTWYYEGARYTLLDTTAADAGACHNNEVEVCGLLTDSREPPDDGRGPYWRLHYLPAAVLVRPIKGHAPKAVLADLSDFAAKGAAFAIVPRPSPAANITVPAANTGTTTKNVRRVNVPLGDYYAVTDYFVQGRSFKEECWVADLSVPPGGLKRATMYVLLTRYKTLDHIRLLRPLSTTPDERTRVVKQFMAATKLDPDLAAELRLLDRRATETRERYTTEYKHARNLEERWTSVLYPPPLFRW
ncbi:hypothetical protein VOLCADRAFT_101022 [Volvox carteri f. nagariensis]|uniref:DUF6570 domain-containing protein n=1 Tax=Volvox carteri f. nagariensis TaxID=3068 RepID=D8ULJ9_VOLCA|nr:uncharacterized protein VOLCADRAFT_101022 [Volvox carteri f. nagariensis]EFJ39400.1 hypothetical protein VOLCADRAFT_101022 [Volvox carteri f. nagariensis]|eukprot:XP_002959535.1 hypothetical protein VOLCADRAFT_101022 [Volvox carteri f. nagariensis]